MALDFQQVQTQVTQIGNLAPERQKQRAVFRKQAQELLHLKGNQHEWLTQRVELVVNKYDPTLRCAIPFVSGEQNSEPINHHQAVLNLPEGVNLISADGSQILPDRHAEVNFSLINVGAIRVRYDSQEPADLHVQTTLFGEESSPLLQMTEVRLALLRDFYERQILVDLSKQYDDKVITITDGPMELWGSGEAAESETYRSVLASYQNVLRELMEMDVITAGYVDKPAANLVVRLLEIASLDEIELTGIRKKYPLSGVTDFWLFRNLLHAGERSSIFAIQSRSSQRYRDELGLHFFYINVGMPDRPWLARVEIPRWVAINSRMINDLHAVLIDQCRIMGGRPYPYILHRAHETAVVSPAEKDQVQMMLVRELRRLGLEVGEISHKQAAKDLSGKRRYK